MPENEKTDELARQAAEPAPEPGPPDDSRYGNIPQIKADILEIHKALADLEARVEPLQEFTNKVNQYNQQLADLGAKIVEQGMKLETDIGAVARRIDALEAHTPENIKVEGITVHSNVMDHLESVKATIESVKAGIESRLVALETRRRVRGQ